MIARADLEPLSEIAKGAEGTVYRVGGTIRQYPIPLAFKKVGGSKAMDQPTRLRTLENMRRAVGFRRALPSTDQITLDGLAAWPVEMVEDGGQPIGCLLPLLGDDFFFTAKQGKRMVLDLSRLSATETQAKNLGQDRSSFSDPLVRLAILTQLAFALAFLHRHDIVYGDLSLKNVAFATDPPRVLLMDCDATAHLSDLSRKQGNSPFFAPPELATQRRQDKETDVYKLGLCIIRGLSMGAGVTQLMHPHQLPLDSGTKALLARAVSSIRSDRPTAEELFDRCVQSIQDRAHPPVLKYARVSQTRAIRGQDIVIAWDIPGARTVEITTPDGHVQQVTQGSSHTFRVDTSGPVKLRGANRHGDFEIELGYIQVFDLPAFSMDDSWLPRPIIPSMGPVVIQPSMSALPPVPRVGTKQHLPPVLVHADTSWVAEQVHGVSRSLTSLTGSYGGVVSQASRDAVRAARALMPMAPTRLTTVNDTRRARAIIDTQLDRLRVTLRKHAQAAGRGAP